MRFVVYIVAACLAGLALSGTSSAQDAFSKSGVRQHYGHYEPGKLTTFDEATGIVTVRGTGRATELTPDRAMIRVMIKGTGSTMDHAGLELASVEQKLRGSSKLLSGTLNVTEQEHCSINYDDKGPQRLSLYKELEMDISAEKTKTAITALLAIEGLHVIHAGFWLSPDREAKYRDKAREEAKTNAKESALKFAEGRKLTLGTLVDAVVTPSLQGATRGTIEAQCANAWHEQNIEIGAVVPSPVSILVSLTARYNTSKSELK